ncbi:MAG: NUDIX domain-containing protein [Nevskiales bacterium]|nr:NUDIX domain-containing protein [Nevskiales bacterium]
MSAPFRYCPQCTEALVEREHGGMLRQACPDAGCGYVYWDNPTPVVAAVVEHEGEIILARNALWPQRFFALVTGFLERNEDPAEAVLREVEEELGLQGSDPGFIGHYRFERMNQLIIAYHVVAHGRIELGEELSEYIRVPFDKVRYWPAATGLALRDWLRSRGYDPQQIELPRRG